MQSKNSGLSIDDERLFYDLQIGRVEACFDWLEAQAQAGAFAALNYPTIALITLLDWVAFRELRDLSKYPALLAARAAVANAPGVQESLPAV